MNQPLEYLDFVLDFHAEGEKTFTVVLQHSPVGGAEAIMRLPFEAEETEALLGHLDVQVRGPRGPSEGTPEVTTPKPTRGPEEIGSLLYDALLGGEIGTRFRDSLDKAQEVGKGLRLRLVFSPEREDFRRLAPLPWELLYREDTRDFLVLSQSTSLVRTLVVKRSTAPIPIEKTLRVLVVMAQPEGWPSLALENEWRGLEEEVHGSPGLYLTRVTPPSLADLRAALERRPCDVLHFIGHGDWEDTTAEGALLFEKNEHAAEPVPGPTLAQNLKLATRPCLAVLNACNSGRLPRLAGADPFSGVATALTLAGVPAVVATQFPISDSAAIAFSRGLYRSLARRDPFDTAVNAGRIEVFNSLGDQGFEWSTPTLFLRTPPDGQAFEWRDEPTRDRPWRLGIRTFLHAFEDMELETDDLLKLETRFDGRALRPGEGWNDTIAPAVKQFMTSRAQGRRMLRLHIDAHMSVAFFAGHCLDTQAGVGVTVRQRSFWGATDWPLQPDIDERAAETPLWNGRPIRELGTGGEDLLVAVGVSGDALPDVEVYYEQQKEGLLRRAGRLLAVTIHPFPGTASVRNGGHVFNLVQWLVARIRQEMGGTDGEVHLFINAPVSFTFALGQQAQLFLPVKVYEFHRERRLPGDYSPGVRIGRPKG